VAPYEEAAFKLKPDEISNVVETDQGFFIIKLLDRRGEEIRVAEILIRPTANVLDEGRVRDELLSIRERALKGEDFGKLATEYSDDPETNHAGGMLGRTPEDNFSPEQKEIIDSLHPGDISAPIHIGDATQVGYQIIKLINRIPPHPASLKDDYREIEAMATQWKQADEIQKFITQAKSNVYMDVRDLGSFYK
jgi:peptidyl-prolyl cis-trans isomerase SurA